MPAAPNRWIITKRVNGVVKDQWLIQSDYVYEQPVIFNSPKTIIPIKNSGVHWDTGPNQPFRYMGRSLPFSDARNEDPGFGNSFKNLNRSKSPLTVIGYGDIKFSAFYPNCLSVFGFNDAYLVPSTTVSGMVDYQVIGWVAEGEDDFLSSRINQEIAAIGKIATQKAQNNSKSIDEIYQESGTEFLADLNKELKRLCSVEMEGLTELSKSTEFDKTLYYGKFSAVVTDGKITMPVDKPEVKRALGNTGTEALSALLSQEIATDISNLPTTSPIT